MTNIKARGFTAAQLQEHLAELEEDAPTERAADVLERDEFSREKEIAWLRKELGDLQERLMFIRKQPESAEVLPPKDTRPWLFLAAAAATTLVLGLLVRRSRVGAAGAASIPMIADRLRRRL